ncbi:MAG: Uma2 family endonuclease [Bryobacteraceae bacterium]
MATATLITSAEFLARPDEFDENGNRIKEELIGGEVVQMPRASKRHDVTKNWIGRILFRYLDSNPGQALTALIEAGFVVTKQDIFAPDVAVFRSERLAEEGRLINGAPEIAIEVISPTDTVGGIRRKIKAYLENGGFSVWVFYEEGSIAVHAASGVRELKGDQLLEDPLLPGFSMPASTFFTQA